MPAVPATIPLPGGLDLSFRIAGEDLIVRLGRRAKVNGDPIATAIANAAVVNLRGNELHVGKARFWIPSAGLPVANAVIAHIERRQ